MNSIRLLIVFCLFLGNKNLFCQSLNFVNPSFEGAPAAGVLPAGWVDCGFPTETAPDIQPGFFSVNILPKHGTSYLGMVARDNNTWEAAGQQLSFLLMQNNCYDFCMDLCRSRNYNSYSRKTNMPVNYSEPIKLRIWGGTTACDKKELLYESALITSSVWINYNIRIHPKNGNYTFIVFEAYHNGKLPYNGNLLMDNISALIPVHCNSPFTKDTIQSDKAASSKTFRLEDLKTHASALKKGDIVQLPKLYFDADKAIIKEECESTLNDIYSFLLANPLVTIEVGGHTNNYPTEIQANELSLKRAKAVANWLIAKGIAPNRILYKGYGKNQPLFSNTTLEGREKNQRVEIKIISITK